mgnify:CR=1 FL=1
MKGSEFVLKFGTATVPLTVTVAPLAGLVPNVNRIVTNVLAPFAIVDW